MIGLKVDKNNSQATVQKKPSANSKSLASPPVAQLCGNDEKDDKSKTEQDGSTAFAHRNSFWSPETVQGKFEGSIKQLKSAPSFSAIQLQATNNNTGLPNNVKSGVEQLSGIPMNDVKVHYNSSKPAQLHAHAYAQGTEIHVAPGQEKHVPHEAWHVVQQKQGRVQATTQMKGMVPVNDDAGLEKEADVMGAKAVQMASMEEEEPVQQKQAHSDTKFSPVFQRVVIQRKPADIRAMIPVANQLLSEGIFTQELGNESTWKDKLLKATPQLADGASEVNKGVAGSANLIGSFGDAAASAVGGAAEAAQDIVEGIGLAISVLTSCISTVIAIHKSAKGDEEKLIVHTELAIQLGETLRSGAKAANAVLSHVNGVSGAIMSMLPGLGLAIAGSDLLLNAYNAYNASSAQDEMGEVSNSYREDLKNILGKDPENFSELFKDEKRGKFFNRETYLRIKPGTSSWLEEAKNGDSNAKLAFLKFHALPDNIDFDQLYKAIRFYELGSKMQEINQKRKVQGMRNIFTDLIQIGAEIAKIFPADGGITAGVLTGVAGGAKAAQAAGKFLQSKARNNGLGDSDRSEDKKHMEYVTHTKSIYQYISEIDPSLEANNESQLNKAERFISATGADLETVFSLTSNGREQADLIVKAMKKGR